jgi:hypothetical protein
MNEPLSASPAPRSVFARMASAWDRFFFRPADPTTLGLIRICCGLIAVYTLVAFTYDLENLFGKHAFIDLPLRNEWRREHPVLKQPFSWKPAQAQQGDESDPYFQRWGATPDTVQSKGTPIWSIWFHVTEPAAMRWVHFGILGIACLFTVGFCARITSVLTWLGMLSYIQRSDYSVFGVDTMTALCLLYLMIGPSGAALSVDRLIGRWWRTYRWLRQNARAGGPAVAPPRLEVTPSVSANLAIRLMQINTCLIYLAAGLAKLQGSSWWTGEAIWGVLANYEFAPMQYPAYLWFLQVLSKQVWLWQLFITAGTVFTLAFEIGFTFLVWRSTTRWLILAMAVTLHGGIGLFMGLKTFSLMMLTLVLSFVPPEVIHRLLRRLGRGPVGLRLFFPARSPRALRAAALVHALDVNDQVALIGLDRPAEGEDRLRLETPDGQTVTGPALAFRLVRCLSLFRVFFPWNWFGIQPFRTRQTPAATSPPAGLPEPVSLRPTAEAIRKRVRN